MADSSMSAGELRRRYHKGGSAKDSDMSASQIRARHGVKNREFAGAVSAGHIRRGDRDEAQKLEVEEARKRDTAEARKKQKQREEGGAESLLTLAQRQRHAEIKAAQNKHRALKEEDEAKEQAKRHKENVQW